MSKNRNRVRVYLSDTKHIKSLSEEEIHRILRAADDIIASAGRGMLVKILKGSKDKKLLELGFNTCPSYGFYSHLTLKEIEPYVDWMIKKDYLCIDYQGRLPMIVFSEYGWLTYQPIYAKEVMDKILISDDYDITLDEIKDTHPDVIRRMLEMIEENQISDMIPFLYVWKKHTTKKLRKSMNETIRLFEE